MGGSGVSVARGVGVKVGGSVLVGVGVGSLPSSPPHPLSVRRSRRLANTSLDMVGCIK